MTTIAEVKIVTADECGCQFADSPHAHDHLIRFEQLAPIEAGLIMGTFIGDEDPNTYLAPEVASDWPFGSDPNEFELFVAQHNWQDPAAMCGLARLVSFATNQAWEGRAKRPGGLTMGRP